MPAYRSGQSEPVAECKLEGARPVRAEELARCLQSTIEVTGSQDVVHPRVVPVGCAADVGDIEQIEHLRDGL